MSDPEPRRSVRATKGQHKALEQLDNPPEAPKRRGAKKGKKAAAQEEPEEEVIRCVCGATEQDDHSDEAWIACDSCGAWQHNVCMGMSQFEEDLDRDYFCELCKPENHKELLESIERGEKLWEVRRKAHEEEAEAKKKKKGGKKGKGKRVSDPKEEATAKKKQSPAPAVTPTPPEPTKKEPKAASAKRKASEAPPEKDTKPSQKLRKVSETQAVPVPAYSPPADLATKISDLPDNRQGSIKALSKSLTYSITAAEKNGTFNLPDGVSVADRAQQLALQVERAVHDTYANQAYSGQVRTLTHNLKTNQDLCNQLLAGTLTPPMLASMTTEELASKELKKETAEMKARAEKQAIKITEDGPRIRRTHKGDEVVGEDAIMLSEVTPGPSVRRQSQAESKQPNASRPTPLETGQNAKDLRVDIKHSPSRQDFDINKVFSSVKSPTASQNRRPSAASPPAGGPGEDPEVDRLLDDGASSPPYSPTEDSDPDVIWRGNLMMNTIANISMTAKHIAGCNLKKSIGLDWSELIPRSLAIAGRIDEEKAITYLCSLRFSEPTDIVVVALSPASEAARSEVQALVDYFVPKKKYGVISDKSNNNVRDTYLVPVLPGDGSHPEFLLNLEDNNLPWSRTEPTLLVVIVYRNDPATMERIRAAKLADQLPAETPADATPSASQGAFNHAQRLSVSGPAFSPTSPQGAFPSNLPTPRNGATPSHLGQATPTPHARNGQVDPQAQQKAQKQGEELAREVLGNLINSPTAVFIMPQAHKMSRREWEVIRNIYSRDPLAREDLNHLSRVLEKESHGPQPGGLGHSPASAPALAAVPVQPAVPAPGHQQPQIAPPVVPQQQTPIHPPQVRNTPIPPPPVPPSAMSHTAVPPPVPHVPAGPPRQTPIPPPTIPPPSSATAGPPA
ncbi:SPOC-domain-containing protein [Thozetella sp. PMI_491]|nr:SPOC-domain-containing protein [Thozetella sp. PMI_491]